MAYNTNELLSFVSLDCNRKQWLQQRLINGGLSPKEINILDASHILVKYDKEFYDSSFMQKTIIAHYDRATGTQGANDNSATVLEVLDFALKLKNYKGVHNIRIWFSDKEEVQTGVKNQGSFGLATLYKKMQPQNDFVFVFDCCARGDIPILAKPKINKLPKKLFPSYNRLHKVSCDMLKTCFPQNWLCLPAPYSDNAGFIANGIFAESFTMLPKKEANDFLFALENNPTLESDVINNKKEAFDFLPETWKILHTPKDNVESLPKDLKTKTSCILQTMLNYIADLKVLC